MKKWLEKVEWSKFRIRGRRDWTLFWIFAILACYGLGLRYASVNERWLFQFANPYMTEINQPHSWGQLMGALFLLAMVTEVVLFLCKKPVQARILVLAGALLMPAVIVAGYRIHTNLIVSPLWKDVPAWISVRCRGEGQDKALNIEWEELTEGQQRELLELCRTIEPVPEEARGQLSLWYRENSGRLAGEEDSISLRFDERYGHNYSVRIGIREEKIFLWRGYSRRGEEITFFEDNGLIEWMEKVRSGAL